MLRMMTLEVVTPADVLMESLKLCEKEAANCASSNAEIDRPENDITDATTTMPAGGGDGDGGECGGGGNGEGGEGGCGGGSEGVEEMEEVVISLVVEGRGTGGGNGEVRVTEEGKVEAAVARVETEEEEVRVEMVMARVEKAVEEVRAKEAQAGEGAAVGQGSRRQRRC
ncbi:hypothetical protein CYMTET_55609 [Cymbomonas tetramitiformis]|uniref:Uncharacterized protein n=1 Tax=Cymbomonas tetramitiformis TaxID=36881 RepID=A0AAE0BDS1_9CHLO|nr:hypothetical protein CYMTET_55609 [Cymbomonas tetramitiformis]